MVSDNDAMVIAPFADKLFDLADIHGINLRKRLVENVERCIAQKHQV